MSLPFYLLKYWFRFPPAPQYDAHSVWWNDFGWRYREWYDAKYDAAERFRKPEEVLPPWPLVVSRLVATRWLPFWFVPLALGCRLAVRCGFFRVQSAKRRSPRPRFLTIGQYDLGPYDLGSEDIPF